MSNLPSGYTKLDYIVFDGSTYFNTGILSTATTKIVCKLKTSTQSRVIFGSRTSTSEDGLVFGFFGSSSAFAAYGGASVSNSIGFNPINTLMTVVLSSSDYTINGASKTITRGTFKNFYNIFLGSWNNAGSPDSRMYVGNIYSFSIYYGDTLKLNYIPVKSSSGTVGFYETVSGTFKTPTTGTLTGGTVSTITYKTVIANAIEGFNDIQKKIYDNSGQLSTPTASSPASVSNIIGALKPANLGAISVVKAATYMETSTTDKSSGIQCSVNASYMTMGAGLVKQNIQNSGSLTFYLTGLTVPSDGTLNSLIVNGTAKVKDDSTGSVIWDGWKISISKSSTEDILVFDPVE